MNLKACFSVVFLGLFAVAAEAQTPAENIDKIADDYCKAAGGSYEESRRQLLSRGLTEDRSQASAEKSAFPLTIGTKRYGIVLLRLRTDAGIVESCRVIDLLHASIDDVMRGYAARNLPLVSSGTTNRETHYLLADAGSSLLAKSFNIVGEGGMMAIGYSKFPAQFRDGFKATGNTGSLLDQERKRNASTMSMKCRMDGKTVELQVAAGKGLMGPFPMEDLEVDGTEIAFKFQGVVHYFDFAKKSGRRSTMGASQTLDCF